MSCACTKEPVIRFVWDSRAKEVRFYINPDLSEAIIKYDLKISRVPTPGDPERYNAIINCPVCDEPIKYKGVPRDWECLASPGTVITVPVSEMVKRGLVKTFKFDPKRRTWERERSDDHTTI
jgi:hypothetical protein